MLNKGIKSGLKRAKNMGTISGSEIKMMRKAAPSLRGRAAKKYGPMSGMDMLIKVTKPKKYL